MASVTTADLKDRVLGAAGRLVGRQIIGMIIALVGTTTLARLIGPTDYGLFVICASSVAYIATLATLGIGTYLVRFGTIESEQQAYAMLLGFSVLATAAVSLLPFVLTGATVALTLPFALAVPAAVLNVVPAARLERELRFDMIVWVELTGQIAFYAVALPCALLGGRVWAPILGWVVSVTVSFILAFHSSGRPFGLTWRRALCAEMLRYGLSVSSSEWIWQARRLVNPWIVGPLLGAETVGIIALAQRFVEAAIFLRGCAYRLAMPLLARMAGDNQLPTVIEEGSFILVALVGTCLIGFAGVARTVVVWFVGARWDAVFGLFPFLGAAALIATAFTLSSVVLYVERRAREVGAAHALSVALLALTTLVLVPKLGMLGYGIAELIAAPALLLIHYYASRALQRRPRSLHLVCWVIALATGIFYPLTFGVVAIAALFCYRPTWRLLAGLRA